jgi:hypothetical protein
MRLDVYRHVMRPDEVDAGIYSTLLYSGREPDGAETT